MASIDPEFLKLLACPQCHAALEQQADELICTRTTAECGLVFPVRNEIPVLLVEEARSRTDRSDQANDE